MDYFEHSTRALQDDKIRLIVDEFGIAGKGVLDGLYEYIGEQHEHYFILELTSYNLKILEANFNLGRAKIMKMIKYFVQIGLFHRELFEDNFLFSINFFKKHTKYLQKFAYNFHFRQKTNRKISEIPKNMQEEVMNNFEKYYEKITINIDKTSIKSSFSEIKKLLTSDFQSSVATPSQGTSKVEKKCLEVGVGVEVEEGVVRNVTPEKETTPELEKYSPESTPYQYASELIELVKINFQNIPIPNIQKWAKEFDLLFRTDKIPEAEVRKVMQWALTEGFWRTIIRSARKFRDKFGTIKLQMERKNGINQNSNKQPRDYQQVANEIEATSHRW